MLKGLCWTLVVHNLWYINKDLVPQDKIVEGDAGVLIETRFYIPLAKIELEVDRQPISIEAAVSGMLPVDVFLGTDVLELTQLLGGTTLGKLRGDAMVVMTRARARQQREEEAGVAKKEVKSDVLPSPVELSEEDSEQWMTNPGSTFDNDIFVLGKKKVKLTRGDKRKLRQQYWGFKDRMKFWRDQVNMY